MEFFDIKQQISLYFIQKNRKNSVVKVIKSLYLGTQYKPS